MQIRIGTRRKNPLRKTLMAIALIAFMPIAFVWLVNQGWLLTHILRIVNLGSPTQIALSDFTWNPLTSSIDLRGVGIHHEPRGSDAWIEGVSIKYKPLGLLRGKLLISDFDVHDAHIILPPSTKEKVKKRRRLKIGRLLLLHSLIVEHADIQRISVAFGKDTTFRANSIQWSLKPRFTGDTTLLLEGNDITLYKSNRNLLSANSIAIKASTRLSRWNADFPYLNSMQGLLEATDIDLQALPIDSLKADLSYTDGALDLKDLRITVGGNNLIGNVALNIPKQTFKVLIDIPKPLHLPYLGKNVKTIDTAGDLSGRIQFDGTGLVLRESRGKGNFDFSHRFSASPDFPVEVGGPFRWAAGAIDLNDTRIAVGNDTLAAQGRINIPQKRMAFSCRGEKFPIEAIFDKFRNPHLQKIFGKTDVQGTFEGWGKSFTAKVTGTTFEGGFKPIVGERVETEFEATYNTLDFAWKIYQGNRQTGTADLLIGIGPKVEGAIRSKNIDLKGSLSGHDLAPSFPGFNLTGTADGEIELAGPHTNFKGTAKATVVDGSWLHVPIDFMRANADLTRYKLTFDNIELTPSSISKQTFIAPLVMDLTTGKFRLHGTPIAGLDIDLGYLYDSKRVQIQTISYDPPKRPGEHIGVAGSVVVGGAINLNAKGQFDLSILNPVKALIREASGPASLDLRASGTTLSPALHGSIVFGGNALSPRPVRLSLEQLAGTVRFEGYRIHFDGLAGIVEDGSFTLGGWIEHRGFKLANANLLLNGKELGFRTAENTFRMTFDGDLALKGAFPHPLLEGDVNILDGRYTKDFVILEQIGGGRSAEEGKETVPAFNPRLDLKIRNSGDLLIRNNVGDIDLKADIVVTGTRTKPEIRGAINAREGRINYMGLNFDIERGFVEFRGPYSKPYLEVEASRELRLYNLSLLMYGYTDNLSLDLEGTSPSGPLEKRDVVSLLAFGITEQERRETEAARTGSQMGISVAAQQVGQMLERPITSATHLDIFRIEAAEEDTDSDEPGKVATRLRVGKQLTDRLSVDFSTDIDTKDAEQTVTTEYLITDNVLIKGSRSSNAKYEGNVGLRFRLR